MEPDELPFEPIDTVLSDRDTYRDYKVESRRIRACDPLKISDVSSDGIFARQDNNPLPSIDLVCRRLTMKWEPIFNVVFRYIYCRCVIRLSTPSLLLEEMTFLRASTCPRHNTQGTSFRDYSELALPRHLDPYFGRFGGYNAFWALLHCHAPWLYHDLSGPSAITTNELEYGYVDLAQIKKSNKDGLNHFVKLYWSEVAEALGIRETEPPTHAAESDHAKHRGRAAEETTRIDPTLREEIDNPLRQQFRQSPVGRELRKIDEGNWDGTPHWRIKD